MAIQLVAGQIVADDFTLLHPIEDEGREDHWLAMQGSTQERVQLDLIDTKDIDQTNHRLNHYKSLIHPNVLLSYSVIVESDQAVLVSAYRRGLKPMQLSQPFMTLWPQLKVIVETLQYAHSLGFFHGAITPNDCVVGDDGTPYLTSFGVTSLDTPASARTDVYGIAQIVYTCLTGSAYDPANPPASTPIDPDLENLLMSMLSPNIDERPENFAGLLELVDKSAEQTLVKPAEFARPTASGDAAEPQQDAIPVTHKLPRERSVVSLSVALAALAALVAFAAILFLVLPQTAQEPNIAMPTAPATSTAPTSDAAQTQAEEFQEELAPLELAKLEELKARGVELAAELLRRQVEVEDIGGRLWAGNRYDQSTELGIAGDEAYRDEQFALAVEQYMKGIALLTDVIDEADSVFADYLSRGEEALLTGDFATAIESYEIVTRIEPNDPGLAKSLARANTLEQVVNLSSDGEVLERNGDLSAALDAFRAANDLDELWQPASDGILRIKNQIARNRFQDEMSKGFEAIASEAFDDAEAAFERAQTILPNSTEPNDGLQQIALAKVQAEIRGLNQQIVELEKAGDWAGAIPLYENILNLAPVLTSATSGMANAKEKADLKTTIAKYIEQPQLMQSDDELDAAKSALIAATRAGAGFRSDARDLSHIVSLARIEVQVTLTSDRRTDVAVYQVGRYGALDRTQLSLIPGVYTFVGKRSGYRDVYQEVHIKGDINPMTIDVRCTERI